MRHRDIKSMAIPTFHASESCEKSLRVRNNCWKRQTRNHLFFCHHLAHSPRQPHRPPPENHPSHQMILSKWCQLPPGCKFRMSNPTWLRSLGVGARQRWWNLVLWLRAKQQPHEGPPHHSSPDTALKTQPLRVSPDSVESLGVFVPMSGNTSTCQRWWQGLWQRSWLSPLFLAHALLTII